MAGRNDGVTVAVPLEHIVGLERKAQRQYFLRYYRCRVGASLEKARISRLAITDESFADLRTRLAGYLVDTDEPDKDRLVCLYAFHQLQYAFIVHNHKRELALHGRAHDTFSVEPQSTFVEPDSYDDRLVLMYRNGSRYVCCVYPRGDLTAEAKQLFERMQALLPSPESRKVNGCDIDSTN